MNIAQQASNRTVAERLAAAFQRHGVTVAFGQSIPTAFHLAAPQFGIKQAAYRTENAGGAMADAYARISNRVSVVPVGSGEIPAFGNALASAVAASDPGDITAAPPFDASARRSGSLSRRSSDTPGTRTTSAPSALGSVAARAGTTAAPTASSARSAPSRARVTGP